ncbi:MAG: tetratricopeptide repeat protein [Bacteriovoracia bacterium]
MKKRALVFSGVILFISGVGCLKTRADLRGDNDQNTRSGQTEPGEIRGNSYAIDEIKSEINRLNGRIEDIERARQADKASSGKDANEARIKQLEDRIAEMEIALTATQEALKKAQTAPPKDPGELFDTGKKQHIAGKLDEAVKSFSAYLAAAPSGGHVEDAYFLRGESHFSLRNYKKAIADYSQFPEKYNRSRHMPQALYKIGLSMENLNMATEAKAFYQELVEKYPKSNEAKLIKAKLNSGKAPTKTAKSGGKKKSAGDGE